MPNTRTCPQCQQPLSTDAPDGLCPQCLIKAAAGPPPSAAGDESDIIDIGDPAEVAKKLPQFEILELLGRGGMGVVYRARQVQLDRIVALKILPPLDAHSPDFVARFTREARSLAKLNHPNIVHVYDFGETGGLYYIIMEFVDGANLRDLYSSRKLAPAEALAIVPKICDALEYAHEEGIVHRDIKPENILIDKKGRVKIADFGLAKLLHREPLDMTLTLSGMALGTVRYMAPEQMDKPETVDHRADLYSLGVVIYEMLTGELPVGRFDLPSQKAQVDVRLDEIVLHALEREPARRYQHASQVRDDVEKVTSNSPCAPAPQPKESNADTGPIGLGKIALWMAIGGLVLPVLLALIFEWWAPSSRPPGLYGLCIALGVVAELVAFGCGVAARRTGSGKAAILISSGSFVLISICVPAFTIYPDHSGSRPKPLVYLDSAYDSAPIPQLETVTSGIGAQFEVPAGQVVTFEVVARRNNATDALPNLAAYVIAPTDRGIHGTFLWAREKETTVAGTRRRPWKIDLVTEVGGASTGGLELPEELDVAVGSMSLGLALERDREAVHWIGADADQLPADGSIGLRVRTVAHGLKPGESGCGASTTDWEKSTSLQHSRSEGAAAKSTGQP